LKWISSQAKQGGGGSNAEMVMVAAMKLIVSVMKI
jgi:hypothetical protein